jgi:[acyl-carrier-protein] S-malonyltransferase
MRTAFLMAGQGAQEVGMGVAESKACAGCRATLEEANGALGYSLSGLMAEGPSEQLQQTVHAQPAILTLAVAHARHLIAHGLEPVALAGHSLGQYSALVIAGALSLSDAVKLVARRGALMQEAVPEGRGGMLAVSGLDADSARQLCAKLPGEVVVACLNAPGRLVLSGERNALDAAADQCDDLGVGAVFLPVSAPFHSPMLRPMRAAFTELVRAVPLKNPSRPVLDNVSNAVLTEAEQIREALVAQVEAPVRFEENLRALNAERVVQCGPGKALLGFASRTLPELKTQTFADVAEQRGAHHAV